MSNIELATIFIKFWKLYRTFISFQSCKKHISLIVEINTQSIIAIDRLSLKFCIHKSCLRKERMLINGNALSMYQIIFKNTD